MTLFAYLCTAFSVISTAALLPSTVDPSLWRAVRGRYVRAVELAAVTAAAVTFVALSGPTRLVDAIADTSRHLHQIGAHS